MELGWLGIKLIKNKKKWNKMKMKVLKQNNHKWMIRARTVNHQAVIKTKTIQAAAVAAIVMKNWASKDSHLRNLNRGQKWKTEKETGGKWRSKDREKSPRFTLKAAIIPNRIQITTKRDDYVCLWIIAMHYNIRTTLKLLFCKKKGCFLWKPFWFKWRLLRWFIESRSGRVV